MPSMSLKDFYQLSLDLTQPKKRILYSLLNNTKFLKSDYNIIYEKHQLLNDMIADNFQTSFKIKNELNFTTDISYELLELKKDLLFLDSDDYYNYSFLKPFNDSNFTKQVASLANFLSPLKSSIIITDRDGTINNYCARYLTSIQSVYNAFYLSLFAKNNQLLILTSAPLINLGMADISLFSPSSVILAGSKGREYLDNKNNIKTYAIPADKQNVLDLFNSNLNDLLKKEEFEILNYIGSGLQYKFGQTTIARQDISKIIPDNISEHFLQKVKEICRRIDPENKNLFIEDTGLDIEIILAKDDSDFNKGDGVEFLNNELNLSLDTRNLIICGDTSSDISMVTKALEYNKETKTVFVTQDHSLQKKVLKVTKNCFFVNSPDVLVAAIAKNSI